MRVRTFALVGQRLEEIYLLSHLAYLKSRFFHFPCELRFDRDCTLGRGRNLCGVYAPQSFCATLLDLFGGVSAQLRVQRCLDGNLLGGRDYLRFVRGGFVRQRRYGVCRFAEKRTEMEEKPCLDRRCVLRVGVGGLATEYCADYGVKENAANLFKQARVCGIY